MNDTYDEWDAHDLAAKYREQAKEIERLTEQNDRQREDIALASRIEFDRYHWKKECERLRGLLREARPCVGEGELAARMDAAMGRDGACS